jgi:NAD-dependent DNA ligase
LFELGLAALSGSALGALISKFNSIEELRQQNPRLYEMLIGAGAVAANEVVEEEAQNGQHLLPQFRPPGWHV